MTQNQLQNVIKSIGRLHRHRSHDIRKLYQLGNEIEYEKSKKLEYEILDKKKCLKKIKRKLRRNRLLMQRYLKKIRKIRKKLKKKVRLKKKVEQKLERIRQRKARRLERLRKLQLMRRLVREKRLMRLKQMAELRKSDQRRYTIELRAQQRRQRRLMKRPKKESRAMKKFRRTIKESKEKRNTLEQQISSIRSSLDNWRKKRSALKKQEKTLKEQLSDTAKKGSKMSMVSSKSKKAVGLTTSTSTGISMEKSSASLTGLSGETLKDNKFVPFNVLMGKKSLGSKRKGRKEPWPVGDSTGSERKHRFFSRRRKLATRKSTTSGLGTTTTTTTSATASDSEEKHSRKYKGKLREGEGDISAQSSQLLTSQYSGLPATAPHPVHIKKSKQFDWGNRPKKSTLNLDALRRSFRKLKGKRRHVKFVSFKRPVDSSTLRSIHIEHDSKDYFSMPRHSTSKPSYAEDSSAATTDLSEPEVQDSVYDENYYKNIVRKQTKTIQKLLKAERMVKVAQQKKLQEQEEEQRRREQREKETRRKQMSSNNHDKELERLVQAGLKSQFNLFDVIPDETPIINEEILKMAERGQRINIRDLMPTSRIFDWPTPSASAKAGSSKARKKDKKNSTKRRSSEKRRSSSLRKSKVSTFAPDSDESREELGSEVTVKKFWSASEEVEKGKTVEEEVLKQESEDDEIDLKRAEEKKALAREISLRQCHRDRDNLKSKEDAPIVVCSACGMTNMEPGGACCKFKPKKNTEG